MFIFSPETEFAFASYYGSHMVLQRSVTDGPDRAVIWGYATEVGDRVALFVGEEEYLIEAVIGENERQLITHKKIKVMLRRGEIFDRGYSW